MRRAGPPPRTGRRGPARLDNLSLRDQLRVDRLPLRLLQMMVGLSGFGVSLAMLLRSGLGGAPWDVLHAALAERLVLTVGAVSTSLSVGGPRAGVLLGQ